MDLGEKGLAALLVGNLILTGFFVFQKIIEHFFNRKQKLEDKDDERLEQLSKTVDEIKITVNTLNTRFNFWIEYVCKYGKNHDQVDFSRLGTDP